FLPIALPLLLLLSLHDALPIFFDGLGADCTASLPQTAESLKALCDSSCVIDGLLSGDIQGTSAPADAVAHLYGLDLLAVNGFDIDRKSTRLNSSHQIISYAVFC